MRRLCDESCFERVAFTCRYVNSDGTDIDFLKTEVAKFTRNRSCKYKNNGKVYDPVENIVKEICYTVDNLISRISGVPEGLTKDIWFAREIYDAGDLC